MHPMKPSVSHLALVQGLHIQVDAYCIAHGEDFLL